MISVIAQRIAKYTLQTVNRLAHKLPLRRMNYFAYGANMDPLFLIRRRIYPRASIPAYLADKNLTTASPCEYLGKGFASIESQDGARVFGVVHDISWLEAKILDVLEWVPFRFHCRELGAVNSLVGNCKLDVFYYVACSPRSGLKASVGYRDLLVKAAKKYNFPNNYLDILKALPVAQHFELDHGFCLTNPARRRWGEHRFFKLYRFHDLVRERLCRLLP